jgi:hypothetical protein
MDDAAPSLPPSGTGNPKPEPLPSAAESRIPNPEPLPSASPSAAESRIPNPEPLPSASPSAAESRIPNPEPLPSALQDNFWPAFALCALAALAPIWLVTYPPMQDLPQHAAQIFMWQHYDDPGFNFSERLEFQWFIPYLLGYTLWRVLAFFLPLVVAGKVLVSAAVLAFPLAWVYWFKAVGQRERWWALLGFPLAYSFSFYSGFLSFLLALPLGLLGLASAWRYARENSPRAGLRFVLAGLLVFIAHALVFAWLGAIAAALILTQAGGWRKALRRAWPLAILGIPVVIYGVKALLEAGAGQLAGTVHWRFSLERILYLHEQLLGAVSKTGAAAWLLAAVVLGCMTLRPRRAPAPWIPAIVTAALAFFGPLSVSSSYLICYRYAVLLPPVLLAAFESGGTPARLRAARLLIGALALAWLSLLCVRFARFEREATGFRVVLAKAEPRKKLLPLIFDPTSASLAGLPYLHFGAWYEAEKGGEAGFSFLQIGLLLLRYRPGQTRAADEALAWDANRFSWARYGGCDYYLVRAPRDLGPQLFDDADARIVLEAHAGDWWLYRAVR